MASNVGRQTNGDRVLLPQIKMAPLFQPIRLKRPPMSHFAKDQLNRAAAELTAAERQEKPPSRAVRTDAYGYNDCWPRYWRQKIATFIPSTFARSSTPDGEVSAYGPPPGGMAGLCLQHGQSFVSDYETAVMARTADIATMKIRFGVGFGRTD